MMTEQQFLNLISAAIGAIIGALLSCVGFVFKSMLDRHSYTIKLKKEILALVDICSISYKNKDLIKSQALLAELYEKFSLCYKDVKLELFTEAFGYSYAYNNDDKLKSVLEEIMKSCKLHRGKVAQ